jgi:glyoxylase I family protein
MFHGIEHFAIASPNSGRLADWYVANLEFETIYQHAETYFIQAANGGLIEIISAEGDRPVSEIRTPGMRHIAISVTDFDAAHARLQSQGVTFAGEPFENQGNRLVFFTDPDGNLLHLIQRAKPLPARKSSPRA